MILLGTNSRSRIARRKTAPPLRAAFFPAAGLLLFAMAASAVAPWNIAINTNNVLVVTNPAYGAVGDGVATNTTAIQNAINAAMAGGATNGLSGGTVEFPPGTYLSGPLTLGNNVNLQLDDGAILRMLPFGRYPITWFTNGGDIYFTANNFITGSSLTNIEISGSGAIDGQGEPWWPWANTNNAVRPIMIRLNSCKGELIQNVTLSNSPMFHISISGSSAANSTVQGVTILAPSSSANPPSHNTDACDVDGTNVLVQNCNISVGDDDFTCGGGTSDVLITNNTYGNGHGVSIGSYTDGGVSDITVINCTFNGTENGVRIKSDNDRGGLVQSIYYCNLTMTGVDFPIQMYAYYDEAGTPGGITPVVAATQPVAAVTGTTPFYRNIIYSNITATSASGYPAVLVWARTEAPATNIAFYNVNISASEPFEIYNAQAQISDSQVTLPAGTNTFSIFDAQISVSNSVPAAGLVSFDGLTTNGYGNVMNFDNALASLVNTNLFGGEPLSLNSSTLTVGNNLTLFPATSLNFSVGTNAATLVVTGSLALGGTVNISAGVGFTSGIYTLMTDTGTMSGSLPALGSVPANYNCSLDTSIAGQVRLIAVSTSLLLPPAPINLVAVATNGLVVLSWSPSATAMSYNVMRSTTSGGPYATNDTVTATNYTDVQVAYGATYYYVVSAVNLAGASPDSAEASATPQTPASVVVSENVFSDGFSSSTVNSSSPSAPGLTNTSYEIISSKSWSPTPGIAAGNLKFGIGTTTSGDIEVQALFAGAPVVLAAVGDRLSFLVTFTNLSGLLTQSGAMGFGLYASGQNYPVPGGLNGTATTGTNNDAAGNAQTWAGYVGQLAFTGGSSQILTRPPQTIGTLANNVQDAVTSGSGSSSYDNPPASTVGTASSSASVTLATGNPYTEVLTIMLAATNTLAITNTLYTGTSTNGAVLSQFGGIAAGTTFVTNSFDALAIGWRAMANTYATTIDINRLSVNATLTEAVTAVSPANGATGVCYDTPLYLTYSQPPTLRPGGTIKIFNVTNSVTPADTIDLTLCVTNNATFAKNVQPRSIGGDTFTNFPVIITGNTAAIYPHLDLLTSNQTYYVTVDNGVFVDPTGSFLPGITATNAWQFTTKPGGPANPTNLVVAADGSGDFATVQGAVDSIPANNNTPTLVSIRDGNYVEIVNIKSKNHLTLRGQSRAGTVVGYANNASVQSSTHYRMALKVNADNVAIENLTILNRTPQGGGQAEALMIESGAGRFILNNAEVDSRQDTILANVSTSQGYFNNSLVQGNFDYIWGGGNLFFTNCEIRSLDGVAAGNLTAARTDNGVNGNWLGFEGLYASNGFSFVNCQFTRLNTNVTSVTLADSNGATNGLVAWINCNFDTNCYQSPSTAVKNSQILWQYGNSNLNNSAAVSFGLIALTNGDPRLLAAQNAGDWLNGWQPQLEPNILTNPASQSVNGGDMAMFTVVATGIPYPAFQWLKNGTNLAGQTQATLIINDATVNDAASYSVMVSNAAGTVTSSPASLTVGNSPPVFIAPPADTNIVINAGVNLTVVCAATDADTPAQTLAYSLLAGPAGAAVNAANGAFTWRPTVSQAGSSNNVSVVVADNGMPSLSATNTFSVTVSPLAAPVMTAPNYASGEFSVVINGPVGPDYALQTSTNLADGIWITVTATNSPAVMPVMLTDTNADSPSAQFYRIVTGPPLP